MNFGSSCPFPDICFDFTKLIIPNELLLFIFFSFTFIFFLFLLFLLFLFIIFFHHLSFVKSPKRYKQLCPKMFIGRFQCRQFFDLRSDKVSGCLHEIRNEISAHHWINSAYISFNFWRNEVKFCFGVVQKKLRIQ